MSQQNDWGWGEASPDDQETNARSPAEASDNESRFDDGWQRGGFDDVWATGSQEPMSQPSAFDDDEPRVVEAEPLKQALDESPEKPVAAKAAGPGGSRPNVALLAAAGVLGMAALGGAGWFAWDLLSPKSASAPVPMAEQVAQEQSRPAEAAQAEGDKADADWLDEKKADDQDAQQGQPGQPLAAGSDSLGGAAQAPQPSQAAAAPAVQAGPHADSQVGRLLGDAGPSLLTNPAPQNAAAVAGRPKESPVLPKGNAARQAARPDPAVPVIAAAANKPREVKAVLREPRAASQTQRQTARAARKPTSPSSPSTEGAPARELVEMPQARVMAVYPPSGRWVQAWLKEESSGRTVTLREGDVYRGVKVKEVVAESMRVVFEDGRMIDTNGVGLVPASDDGSKKARKTSSRQPSTNKS